MTNVTNATEKARPLSPMQAPRGLGRGYITMQHRSLPPRPVPGNDRYASFDSQVGRRIIQAEEVWLLNSLN